MDPLRDIERWSERLKDIPPPSQIFTDERVRKIGVEIDGDGTPRITVKPRVVRQWMTDGSLVIWVHPDIIAALPKQSIREMPADRLPWGVPISENPR
jgi:hypothetical protein